MARTKQERPPDPDRLVRRSAGDLHTEDGRFEVSSMGGAGRWYVTDTERHDGLGLALVLGPFGTLDEVRTAIAEQRAEPAGSDGPLPAPPKDDATVSVKGRSSRASGQPKAEPELGPEPEPGPVPEPEPEPEPPPRPPVRVRHARWRARRDERDEVVEVVHRIIEASLGDDPAGARDDLHQDMVESRGDDERLEGPEAVLEAWRSATEDAPATAWVDRGLAVDVMGETAVVRYAYELERDADGATTTERGDDLWVLTREGRRWLAAYRVTTPEPPDEA